MTAPQVPVVGDEFAEPDGELCALVISVGECMDSVYVGFAQVWADLTYFGVAEARLNLFTNAFSRVGKAPSDLRLAVGWDMDEDQPPPVGSTVTARTWELGDVAMIAQVKDESFRLSDESTP